MVKVISKRKCLIIVSLAHSEIIRKSRLVKKIIFLFTTNIFSIVFSNENYLEYFWNILQLFETVAYLCKYGWKLFIFS